MHNSSPFACSEVYDPDTLSVLRSVFDDAWASIENNFDFVAREAARLKLAAVIFELAAVGGH